MENKIKVGCEVFILQENKLLLGKRKNCFGAGTWALPGGHLEYGESLLECAKRELKEELGIDGLELQLISAVENIDERGHYLHMSFLLKNFTGIIENKEVHFCDEWTFFDLNNLPENIFIPHQPILKNYLTKKYYIFNRQTTIEH